MIKHFYILFIVLLVVCVKSNAQQGLLDRIPKPGGGGGGGGAKMDSLKHRTGLEDSITINFRYLDSSRYLKFDSSINDFSKKFLIPSNYVYLGNTGSAAKSLLFSPLLKPGWDAGFHSFDIYKLKPEETRLYNTTRPYTELGYLLGGKQEQLVHLLHTQNINPNWNFAFQYRLLTSPGYFKNQNTAQSNYSLNTFYQSPNRRYHLFFILISNSIKSAENGGLQNKADLEDLPANKDRATINVLLGPYQPTFTSPYTTSIVTGNQYKTSNFLLRQQYDLGIKDSITTDSVTIHLFYPKLRMQHTIEINSYTYQFHDASVDAHADTGFYRPFYNFLSMPVTYYQVQDKWNEIINDFSLYQFPDAKNSQQFFKLGASLQNLTGTFDAGSTTFHNTWVHGEYRNKTRNQKWDAEALGILYLTGRNVADYSVYGSLKRYISKQIGFLQVGFQNVNRSPSFIFDPASSFNLANVGGFNKENTTRIFASIDQPQRKLKLSGSYFLVANYSYFSDYYHPQQASGAFNLLQVSAEKEMRLRKHLYWIVEATLQQKAGNAPVNVPLIYVRSRIGYQGNLGFKNLQLATGLEIKYNTPYKSDGYSPLLGQFYYQDTSTVHVRPTINGYFHFRVKSFTAYIRAENLNTINFKDGFGWTNNNVPINGYPYPGLQIRIGIFWSFVN